MIEYTPVSFTLNPGLGLFSLLASQTQMFSSILWQFSYSLANTYSYLPFDHFLYCNMAFLAAASVLLTALAALNGLLRFLGWEDCRARFLKVQRRIFRAPERELTRAEYDRLLAAAESTGDARLALLMESICATGIRVGEVKYLTVEAASQGRAEVSLKGKIRTILLPAKLCRKLLKYARKQKIAHGEIFLTMGRRSMDRRQIWSAMKRLCQKAGIAPSKVFPHNLRHLFATAYYRAYRDIVKLADMLGHSSIETTRIYLIESGAEHQRQLERLGLVS